MEYIFRGKLCGLICDDCPEALSNTVVRLYRVRDLEAATALVVARPKETFAMLDAGQAVAKEEFLLAEAKTDAEGNFHFELGEREQYAGQAFEIDILLTTVPNSKVHPPQREPLQFSITTLQPRWRQTETGFIAVWDFCLPQRTWCSIRAQFGAWTICGRLRTCALPQAPIAGATVRAFDADWLQDDVLGTASTDSMGRFRIDYTSADFQLTPVSPSINIEWTGGPDVYFTVQLGSVMIINETQADGRAPGRENVGPCLCVELCSDQVQPLTPEDTPHWQQVERFNIHPFPSATGFSALGYAGTAAESLVFGGGVTFKGNCPLRNVAAPDNALSYRFRIGEWSWPGGVEDPAVFPSVPPSVLQPVTQIHETHVGWVSYTNAFGIDESENVMVTGADVLPDGWIRIDGKEVTVDMRDATTAIVRVNSSNFLRTVDLLVLNSHAITSAHPQKLPGGVPLAEAGRNLSAAEREPVRRYRLMFEVRDTTGAMVATDTLDAIVLDNSVVVAQLDLEELRTDACNPVAGGAVHILYTIDHPHLRSYRLSIFSNNGTRHAPPELPREVFAPPPPLSNLMFRGAAGGPHLPGFDGGFTVNVAGDPPCAYGVKLEWETRHYHGGGHTPLIRLYCK